MPTWAHSSPAPSAVSAATGSRDGRVRTGRSDVRAPRGSARDAGRGSSWRAATTSAGVSCGGRAGSAGPDPAPSALAAGADAGTGRLDGSDGVGADGVGDPPTPTGVAGADGRAAPAGSAPAGTGARSAGRGGWRDGVGGRAGADATAGCAGDRGGVPVPASGSGPAPSSEASGSSSSPTDASIAAVNKVGWDPPPGS